MRRQPQPPGKRSKFSARTATPKTLGWALCAIGGISAIRADYAAAAERFAEAETIFQHAADLWGIGLGRSGDE